MRTSVRSIPPPVPTRASDLLAAAAGIGDRIVRQAVWYRGRCSWVAAEAGAGAAPGADRVRPVYRALGPALGDGTAGIALFLAQLHAATADGAVRRAALGAIGQALAHADRLPARGLYAGRPGIAYAAARCGLLLDEERLLQRAARLARGRSPRGAGAARLARGRSPRDAAAEQFDVAGGTAGAIAGLLALAPLLGDERLAEHAQRLGDELADAARRGPEGWSWPVPGGSRLHGLCGMAHGASGAAWALLELFAATGEHRHREAAERALDYERHWFGAHDADWPDLRGVQRRERRGTFEPPYTTTWSHGAPGIALSRLRAWEILGGERHRDEAAIALGTTASSVERELLAPGADFTLGHGLAGNADVLLRGAQLMPAGAALALRAGEIGIGRYATAVDGWPCGAPGGLAPGLLAGHAGIGLLHLRLHDATVPSPLLVCAER